MGLDPERIAVTASDGPVLDAELTIPPTPVAAAVVAHPHPQFGGTMDVPVVQAITAALVASDVATARFNFRGVGASTGTHEDGVGERHDVAAVAQALVARTGPVPLWLTGWSFGGDVSLSVTVDGLAGWVAVTPPLQMVEGGASLDPRPTHLICAAHDQFCSPHRARDVVATWPATTVEVVEAADHFLVGHAVDVARRLTAHVLG